jgi:chemotaxis signal transduction protein
MSIGRFRSTAAFAPRARAPIAAVDRATFVVFAIGAHRFAVSVERVERVLRVSAINGAITEAGRALPVTDLASTLGLALAPSAQSRVLVLAGSATAGSVAVEVDAVFEVATIDATAVSPLAFDGSHTYVPVGARGVFTRQGHSVIVLDVGRALSTSNQYGLLEYADPLRGDPT